MNDAVRGTLRHVSSHMAIISLVVNRYHDTARLSNLYCEDSDRLQSNMGVSLKLRSQQRPEGNQTFEIGLFVCAGFEKCMWYRDISCTALPGYSAVSPISGDELQQMMCGSAGNLCL